MEKEVVTERHVYLPIVAFFLPHRTTVEFYFELKGEVEEEIKDQYSRMNSMKGLTKFEKGGMIDQMTGVSELDEDEEKMIGMDAGISSWQ